MIDQESIIMRRALRLVQFDGGEPIFQFNLTGQELGAIAEISRVGRDDHGKLIGYQRPGVRRHVNDIVEYLDSERPLFPNPILLSLSSDVRFVGSRGPKASDGLASAGHLEIPVRPGGRKVAWIVDGQQRSLALAQCVRKDFAVPVIAFVSDAVDTQREQFLRVNNSKPLPPGLVTELLPEVDTVLPARLAQRRVPSRLCDVLNTNEASPFCGLIRRPSMSTEDRKKAVIADTSIIEMLRSSFGSMSGCLFPYRNIATNETDFEGVLEVLICYWSAVRDVFPKAWAKPPRTSRLMHGAGIFAMGRLMDKVMSVQNPQDSDARQRVRDELMLIEPFCRWTSGRWEELDNLKWNDLQNVPGHRKQLANLLIRIFLRERRVGR